MDADDIRTVLVVGAGTMGRQIALQCAAHGFVVTLLDTEQAALDRARARLDALAGHVASDPAFAHTDVVADVARISATTDPAEAAHEADLVSESVPEDPALKKEIFARVDDSSEPDAICPVPSSPGTTIEAGPLFTPTRNKLSPSSTRPSSFTNVANAICPRFRLSPLVNVPTITPSSSVPNDASVPMGLPS